MGYTVYLLTIRLRGKIMTKHQNLGYPTFRQTHTYIYIYIIVYVYYVHT